MKNLPYVSVICIGVCMITIGIFWHSIFFVFSGLLGIALVVYVILLERFVKKKNTRSLYKLSLGKFFFTAAERKKIKVAAIKFIPASPDNPDVQFELLRSLSAVMDLTDVKVKTEQSWRILLNMPKNQRELYLIPTLEATIVVVNQSFSPLNQEIAIKKVAFAQLHELLKAWIILDFYAKVQKPEYTANIRHFRDYIHNTILMRENIKATDSKPIELKGCEIYIDSKAFMAWCVANASAAQYTLVAAMALLEKEPTILLYEDGVKTREYCLQTENDEDFSGKYFIISICLGIRGKPTLPVLQIDGFVSDNPENRQMTSQDVGYRMEGHFLAFGGEAAIHQREMMCGQDLPAKALKQPGYTIPSNVRLLGICPYCGKSFAFHGYSFYMGQNDVAYSDDGLDVCTINAFDIDKETWTYEEDGKTFRYYNSFNCPHCGKPYIDYKKHPENKNLGVCGCVHLGRKPYRAV